MRAKREFCDKAVTAEHSLNRLLLDILLNHILPDIILPDIGRTS
jgi:hypothetical protein